MEEKEKELFPSPYGVTVIKSSHDSDTDPVDSSFRPLTGKR